MDIPKESRFLVVEDSVNMRQAVVSMIRNMGFPDVSEAEDGLNALEVIKTNLDQGIVFDFIIADHNMPNFTGLELLKHVRQIKEYDIAPFILITTHSEAQLVFEFIDAKVSQFIVKPVERHDFESRLNECYAKWLKEKEELAKKG